MRTLVPLVLLALACVPAFVRAEEAEPPLGRLRLRILDGATAETPARVTVVDERGRSHVPDDALPVAGECMTPVSEGWLTAARGGLPGASLLDPATGARTFYVDGAVDMTLPRGRYRVTVSKGPEFEQRSLPIEVFSEDGVEVPIVLSRWIDMLALGWVSSDVHLHIPRPTPELDPLIASWMRAEDLHVANLLQMGSPGGVVGARQYAFGAPGRYRAEGALLAPGQENPRTWILGHGIVLGASEFIEPGDRYLVYQPVWRRARDQGGLSGYAHWHAPGALIDAPAGLVDFLEVLQLDTLNYDMLYELWSLGFPVAPVAGTDFPCLGDLPGAVRFYARVDAPFSWERWLEAVRHGRTFVTNGPMLDLEVGDVGVGERLRLEEPGLVRVRGRVRFDPTRDDVRSLELVYDGQVVHRVTTPTALGVLSFSVRLPVSKSGWLALRSSGDKLDRRAYPDRPRASAAHTGPVMVQVGAVTPGSGSHASEVAATARDEMARLASEFSPPAESVLLSSPAWMRGVDPETVRKSRPDLLAEIDRARAWYAGRVEPSADVPSVVTDRVPSVGSPDSRTSSRNPGDASRRGP